MNKNDIKNRILTENTAQGILNHLRDLESNRAGMQRRWIWELLQNARDASRNSGPHLEASIQREDGALAFEHNGRGFTVEEVAHLIYHGSTKLDDQEALGRYGSGFLTTHLLSPQIDVSGQLDDGRPFGFCLKREIGSAKELSASMDRAWDEFDANADTSPESLPTRFRYPLGAESTAAVEDGIEMLRRCAPFVVVFNRQFRCINIETPRGTTSFRVIARAATTHGSLHTVTVEVSDLGHLSQHMYLVAEGETTSVSIPVQETDAGVVCLPIGDVPRLFLGFPLVGTETFSFPSVINSFRFTPTENRDGVYLGQSENEANRNNQAAIEEACSLHTRILEFATTAEWKRVYSLADIPPVHAQPWLSGEWLQSLLKGLVSRIRNVPAVLGSAGSTRPKDSILPIAGAPDGVESLWDLLDSVASLRERLPVRVEAAGWRTALGSWIAVIGDDTEPLDEGWDGEALVARLEDEIKDAENGHGTLEDLTKALSDDTNAVEWLNRLYRFLAEDGLGHVVRNYRIVLDQVDGLNTLTNLHRDNGIDAELKAISDDILGLGIRARLRDTRPAFLADQVGKGEKDNKDVVEKIIARLKALVAEEYGEDFRSASSRLFAWLAANEEWTFLTGFPVFAVSSDDGTDHILFLGVGHKDRDESVPLAPVSVWRDDLQAYKDLFPSERIMADAFFSDLPDLDRWSALIAKQYVRKDVIDRTEEVVTFRTDRPPYHALPDGEHEAVGPVAGTNVFLLSKTKIGVMARVRRSPVRARLFWRFLTEWLVVHDPDGVKMCTAVCKCGKSHDYYPAMWLTQVATQLWIPQKGDIRSRATAESLANLLRDSDWTPNSLDKGPAVLELLQAMGVTRLDLMRQFVGGDEEARAEMDDAMTRILLQTDGDLSDVCDFVEDLKADSELTRHLAERRERRRVVHENQNLGNQVEKLVKEGLEDEEFTVIRTGIGSDFEIEYDFVEGTEEIGIEVSRNDRTWLVEVKATRGDSVRMTARQAETAAREGEGFLLCVVPVRPDGTNLDTEEIRANMRFVQNVGPRVEPLCKELSAVNDLREVAMAGSDPEVQLEIEAGSARIRVDGGVWRNGVCLSDLATKLK